MIVLKMKKEQGKVDPASSEHLLAGKCSLNTLFSAHCV